MFVALLSGCMSVTTGPDEAFFPVISAFTLPWFAFELVYPQMVWEGTEATWSVARAEYESDVVVSLSDHVDRCTENRDFIEQWADASEALLAASNEGEDGAAFCEGMPDFLAEMEALGAAQPQVGKVVTLSLCPGCDSLDGALVLGSDEVNGVELRLDADTELVTLADRFDPETCATTEPEPAEGLGVWWFEEGTAELSTDLFGAYSGSFEARGGQDLGTGAEQIETLEATFTTSLCEAPDVARLVRY